jgi:methionine transaminase
MISPKLNNIKTSIFGTMNQMALDYNAINLSQGFSDFLCSEKLIDLVYKYMKAGYNQYAPLNGILELREAISLKTQELYSYKYNPEKEITITAGATQAIYTAITAFVKEDDEVIVFEPAYDTYVPVIELNGGRPVFVELKYPDYHIDWDEVQKVINLRTRMIIINSPHNPTGTILSAGDMEKLKKITLGTNIIILSDEVFEHIIFDGNEHQSVSRFPQLAEKSIVISSFGPAFNATGLRLGYCLAPTKLMSEFRGIHQLNILSASTPVQYAFAEFLKNREEYLNISKVYEQKRNLFISLLKNSRFKILPSSGTIFQLLDYSKITNEKDSDFCVRLTKEQGVTPIPLSAFYHDNVNYEMLRFCFAKSDETLVKACEKLSKL